MCPPSNENQDEQNRFNSEIKNYQIPQIFFYPNEENPMKILEQIGKFLFYFWYKSQLNNQFPKIFDENSILQHPLWRIINQNLFQVKNIQQAQLFIEALVDQLRYDCPQTNFFIAMILTLFNKATLSWDLIPLQEIIFYVIMARSENLPVTHGLMTLKTQLGEIEKFNEIKALSPYSDERYQFE